MSDSPERIWAWPFNDWYRGGCSTAKVVVAGAKDVEYIRADLAAPKVKKLQWEDANFSDNGERETADCLAGSYEVLRWSSGDYGGTFAKRKDAQRGEEFDGCDSMDEAKEKCQADYSRRILSALEGE